MLLQQMRQQHAADVVDQIDRRQRHVTDFFILEVVLGHSEPADEVISELHADWKRRQKPTARTIQARPIFALLGGNRSSRGVTLDMTLIRCTHRPRPPPLRTSTRQMLIQEILSAHQATFALDLQDTLGCRP